MVNLKGSEYEKIENTANDLLEDLGLTGFPLNPFLVVSLLKIKLIKYSELSEGLRKQALFNSDDGFCRKSNNRYIIYYNDAKDSKRITFTIWHEIAHIQLEHLEKDCQKSTQLIETEANHFAIFLMAPLHIIYNLKLSTVEEISSTFGISHECARYVFTHYKRAFRYKSLRNKILNGRIANILSYRPKEAVSI